ncbi:MAG: PIG-L family deacetylase, partial [Candidatus Puniceispirillum sp.]|nr:PIG-L family deacetylase [Candidatus Puniceispirillum sp.]
MKIVGIGAHPDDVEIFFYGFLAACKARGDDISIGVATDGAAGGDNPG